MLRLGRQLTVHLQADPFFVTSASRGRILVRSLGKTAHQASWWEEAGQHEYDLEQGGGNRKNISDALQ